MWNLFNELVSFGEKKTNKISKLTDSDRHVVSNDEGICKIFVKEFMFTYSESNIESIKGDVESYCKENEDRFEFKTFPVEVKEAEGKVSKGSCSPVKIPKQIFKQFSVALSVHIALLFNTIFSSGIINCFAYQ